MLGAGAWPAFGRAAAPILAASPIAGHFTASGVRLWLQGSKVGAGALEFWPAAGSGTATRKVAFALADDASRCALVDVDGLEPDTRYRYRVSIGGETAAEAHAFRTASAPGGARDLRVYFGSCAYTETHTRGGSPYGDELHIFDAIAAQMQADALPHFMLWLGDNLYLRNPSRGVPADFASAALMDERYREVRGKPFLQKLFGATHHYAIWDDHDFGPNDSDRTFALKPESLALFRRYWPNPPMGSAGLPGTCCRFRQEDVEFILLDSRYHRDPEKAPPSGAKALFGEAQMAWLRRALADSSAAFKVVAGGSQFLSEQPNGGQSGWHSYPGERDPFLAWLARERIPGVILLSGDRHNTQVFRFDREGAPPVHEFSCSPLTSKLIALSATDRANPRLLPELAVERRNFGTLEFSGRGGERRATARCFDAAGALLWTKVLATVDNRIVSPGS